MDRLQAMRVFVRVAENGSFANAGRLLKMSPPAVTRAIGFLEDAIGVRLVTRTTRALSLTEAGQHYYEDCRRILADIVDSEAAVTGNYAKPTGTLTVTASVLFGRRFVLPILLEYLRKYPAVKAQTVFLDRIVNLVEEGIDVAIRIGRLPDSELNAISIGRVIRRVVCASPSYLAQHGEPLTPGELSQHGIVAALAAWPSLEWRFGSDKTAVVTVNPRLICNNNDCAIAAAIDGWGLTRVLSYQVADAVADGRLKIVLSKFEQEPLPVHLVHSGGRGPAAKVRSFIDFAAEQLRANDSLHLN